jgi:hypothetical protein
MYWFKQWYQLSKEEDRTRLKEGCRLLETMVLDFVSTSLDGEIGME